MDTRDNVGVGNQLDYRAAKKGNLKDEARRILSSTVGSEPLGKFSTLLDSSTAYKHADSHRYDPFCRVLSMELLQFYYSGPKQLELADIYVHTVGFFESRSAQPWKCSVFVTSQTRLRIREVTPIGKASECAMPRTTTQCVLKMGNLETIFLKS
jgi:hypothetical protein